MSMEINVNTEYGKELWKWDHTVDQVHPNDDKVHGMRPGRGGVMAHLRYPLMMYRARKNPQGKVLCIDVQPDPEFYPDPRAYELACLQVESKNKTCYRYANNEDEERRLKDEGFTVTQQDAIAKFEMMEREIGNAAAEERHRLQRMSKRAQAEYEEADSETHEHLVDVQPKKKRGRPSKGVVAVTLSDPDPVHG